jgi:inhibitor of cysteine peptidase
VFLLLAKGCTQRTSDFAVTGTIVFQQLEGGFYGIKGDDGKNYEPINLPREYQKEGLRVRVEAKQLKDFASIRMWGTVIEIVRIQHLPRE